MMITCTKCKKEKCEDEFNWKNKKLGKRCSCCRDCKKIMQRRYYEGNKQAYLAKIMESRKVRRAAALDNAKEYLLAHPCVDCGEVDIRKLHFDHMGDKEYDVMRMVWEGHSWINIQKEIDKCEVRCANCHMVKTWPDRWK